MDNGNGHLTRPTDEDLERARKNATSKRRLAWELLKQTRNPTYVSLRYGFPLEALEKALEGMPPIEPIRERSASADAIHSTFKRASELIPEATGAREPGEDDE